MPKLLSLVLTLALIPAVSAQDKGPGFLGISVAPLVEETRTAFRIPAAVNKGVILTNIEKGSASEKAGFRVGDVLVFFDGKAVTTVEGLVEAVKSRKAGDKVTYKLQRGTGTIEGTLTLGKRPHDLEVEKERNKMTPQPKVRKGRGGGTDLDRRLDRVAEQIEEMRERVEKNRRGAEKVAKPPRSVTGWLAREERFAAAAAKRGDEKAVHYHRVRMSVLREMRKANVSLAPAAAPAGRLERIEKKLDAILELLQQGRKRK